MNDKNQTLTNTTDNDIRIDAYLFAQFPDYSRSYFQKLIKLGNVFINRKLITKTSHVIKLNDTIEILFSAPVELTVTAQETEFEVLDDSNPEFLVINKPAGLVVHNSTTDPDGPSLVRGLLHRYPEFTAFNEDDIRPGIVHRLDKDTSGIILVARTVQAQIFLANKFKDRTIHKTYLALVEGNPEKEFAIDRPIGRHPVHRHKMSPNGIASRPAQTILKTVKYFEDAALLQATLITGRTHQIRVHLASHGNPVIGDSTYGKPSPLIKRQALHAWNIEFTYKDKFFSFTAPIPDDMQKALDKLNSEKFYLEKD